MRQILMTVALGLCLAAGQAMARETHSVDTRMNDQDVSLEAVQVEGPIWMITGRGGNIGMSVGDDGAFLIDDQYAPLTPALRELIARITDQPVRFVLNTHWHGDHTGGNEQLGETGSLIVAHDNVRRRMSSEQFMAFFDSTVPPSPGVALPVVTFSDSVSFHINGESIRAFHVEHAHTDGDAIVHFPEANVVHMGDVFFNGLYPFIDTGSGGSMRGMLAAIEAALPLMDQDTQVIPGHGPLSDRTGLLAYQYMMRTMADRIQSMIDQGMTLDEVVAAKPSAQFDPAWGGGFIKPDVWVRMLYEDMAR